MFDLTTQNFNQQNCAFSLQLAELAYPLDGETPLDHRHRVFWILDRKLGFTDAVYIHNPNSGTECFCAANQDEVVISFQGSCSVREWLTDLDFKKRDLLIIDGKTHAGFDTAFWSVRQDIRRFLAQHPGKRIFIVGHSLGGALATQCAFDLYRDGSVHNIYTFGEPRGGDRAFVKYYNLKFRLIHFRTVNNLDIVPRAPTCFMGFRHVGTEQFIDDDGQAHFHYPRHKKWISDVRAILKDLRSRQVEWVEDHFTKDYAAVLKVPLDICSIPA